MLAALNTNAASQVTLAVGKVVASIVKGPAAQNGSARVCKGSWSWISCCVSERWSIEAAQRRATLVRRMNIRNFLLAVGRICEEVSASAKCALNL